MCSSSTEALEEGIVARELEVSQLRHEGLSYGLLAVGAAAATVCFEGSAGLTYVALGFAAGAVISLICSLVYNEIVYQDLTEEPEQFPADHRWFAGPWFLRTLPPLSREAHTTVLWYNGLAVALPPVVAMLIVQPGPEYMNVTVSVVVMYMAGAYAMCAAFDSLLWCREMRRRLRVFEHVDAVTVLEAQGYRWDGPWGWRKPRANR